MTEINGFTHVYLTINAEDMQLNQLSYRWCKSSSEITRSYQDGQGASAMWKTGN